MSTFVRAYTAKIFPHKAYRMCSEEWASAHRVKWGQLIPPRKMDEKIKSENMQKTAVFYVYVIF